ncbi:uncharacterized protein TNCV_279891 [Trichonephila clavipes]|nr:uncharacterized protein TNCV_279891 [Trichonephila clavipes]
MVDLLAKRGTDIVQRSLPLHSAKLEINKIFEKGFRDAATSAAKNKSWRGGLVKPNCVLNSPRAAAVAEFRLTGHDFLCAHLYRFNLTDPPLCASGLVMEASRLDVCSAFKNLDCIVKQYWRARCLMT